MHIQDMRPGRLIKQGRSIYTVSTVEPKAFTARLDLDKGTPPERTVVIRFLAEEAWGFNPASERDAERVQQAYEA